MKKQYLWPQGHWNWPIDISHKHGVCNVMRAIERVLIESGSTSQDLINLNCFYVMADATLMDRGHG